MFPICRIKGDYLCMPAEIRINVPVKLANVEQDGKASVLKHQS